jgi:hypothetical protein
LESVVLVDESFDGPGGEWVAGVDGEADVRRWQKVNELIDDKITQRVQTQVNRPQPYLVQQIGWPPRTGAQLSAWIRDAEAIERNRLDHPTTAAAPHRVDNEPDLSVARATIRTPPSPNRNTPSIELPDLGTSNPVHRGRKRSPIPLAAQAHP